MRNKTCKRLKLYANFLKDENQEKYENLTSRRIYQRLKKVWMQDKNFQRFIREAFSSKI